MRPIPASEYRRLDQLLNADVLVWLVAIELNTGDTFFLCSGNKIVEHQGQQFTPYPMSLSEWADSGGGNLPSSTVILSNVGRYPMIFLERGEFDQARFTAKLVLADAPALELGVRIDSVIVSAVATEQQVTLNLGNPAWFDRLYPGVRWVRDERFPGIRRNPN